MTRSPIGEEERGLGATYNDRELQPGVPGGVGIPSVAGSQIWRQRWNAWRRRWKGGVNGANEGGHLARFRRRQLVS